MSAPLRKVRATRLRITFYEFPPFYSFPDDVFGRSRIFRGLFLAEAVLFETHNGAEDQRPSGNYIINGRYVVNEPTLVKRRLNILVKYRVYICVCVIFAYIASGFNDQHSWNVMGCLHCDENKTDINLDLK